MSNLSIDLFKSYLYFKCVNFCKHYKKIIYNFSAILPYNVAFEKNNVKFYCKLNAN